MKIINQQSKKNLTDDGRLYVSVVTTQQLLNVYLRKVVFKSVYQKTYTSVQAVCKQTWRHCVAKTKGKDETRQRQEAYIYIDTSLTYFVLSYMILGMNKQQTHLSIHRSILMKYSWQ